MKRYVRFINIFCFCFCLKNNNIITFLRKICACLMMSLWFLFTEDHLAKYINHRFFSFNTQYFFHPAFHILERISSNLFCCVVFLSLRTWFYVCMCPCLPVHPLDSQRDFPGGPVVKTSCFQCREHRFNPLSGNYDPICSAVQPGQKKKIILGYN